MTPGPQPADPGSQARPSPNPAGGSPRPEAPAVLAGLLSGAAAALLFLSAGYLLYQRLWSGSTWALVAVMAVFGLAGAYAGWLAGVLVFSSTRGDDAG